MLDGVRERAAELGYVAGWGVVKSVPGPLAGRAFRAAADAATVRNGAGARQLRANLRRVVGPQMSEQRLDALVGDALRSYARYWLETFRLPRMDRHDVAERIDKNMIGAANVTEGLARGKGVVLAVHHSGNWDTGGVWLVENHGPFTTVAERLRPESLFDRFVAYRESLGFEIAPLTGGTRSPMEMLTARLRANGVVCLLADRDLSHTGVEVDFFGEPARMPPGPALLAATTGAALLPSACYFLPDGWGLRIDPPVHLPEGRLRAKVMAGTQAMAHAFEVTIAEHPADWHMLQPLWTADLPSRAGRAA
jgi:lauroyl/myristoyl acyltransferase